MLTGWGQCGRDCNAEYASENRLFTYNVIELNIRQQTAHRNCSDKNIESVVLSDGRCDAFSKIKKLYICY